jgi:hypothetical protein
MTRAEFIQQAVLAARNLGAPHTSINEAVIAADALEKSGAAPWDSGVIARAVKDGGDRVPLSQARVALIDAVKSEREACAQIADRNDQSPWGIAREIRARGTP